MEDLKVNELLYALNDELAVKDAVKEELEKMKAGRRNGKWITHRIFRDRSGMWCFDECSVCGKLTPEWRGFTDYHGWNYCPHCGAYMRDRTMWERKQE